MNPSGFPHQDKLQLIDPRDPEQDQAGTETGWKESLKHQTVPVEFLRGYSFHKLRKNGKPQSKRQAMNSR